MDPSLPDSRHSSTSTRLFWVAAVILLALNAYLTSLRSRPAIRDAGYLIGKVFGAGVFFAVLGLVVYGIARAFRKAKTGGAAARLFFWTMAVLFIANCATLVAQVPSPKPASTDTIVTDAERRGLQVDSVMIRHTAFGFVLPHPGPGFSANLDYQRQMDETFAAMPDIVAWAFSDNVKRQVLTIQVIKMQQVDEGAFRTYTKGFREGFIHSKVVDETVRWNAGTKDYQLTMLHQRGFYVKTRCIPRVDAGRSLIICVGTTAFEPDALASSRAGLKLNQ
jgi:hypothetical protein